MSSPKPKIGIVGLSHLGIVWSAGHASLGFPVSAYDPDQPTVDRLAQGDPIVPEPDLREQMAQVKDSLQFSTDPRSLRECPVIFFAKDVPYDLDGRINLAPIDALLESAIPHFRQGVEFIFMGQVPVGYTRKLAERIRSQRPDLDFQLIYRVETLTIGQAVGDFLNPDRIIIGLENGNRELSAQARSVLQGPFGCPVTTGSFESAELTKSAINIYLATAVTFVNTISDLCEKVGADIQEVVAAMKLDKRFSPLCYWRPGLGFAGGHLERDLMSLSKLSEEHHLEPRLLKTIIKNSQERYAWLVQAIDQSINSLSLDNKRPVITLWGLAYKKGTDSLHNAHCLKVIRDYADRAELRAYDPVAKLPDSISGVKAYRDKFEALRGSDILVVLTEWDEFRLDEPAPFVESMQRPVIIDGVHVIGSRIRKHPKMTYIGMGISNHA